MTTLNRRTTDALRYPIHSHNSQLHFYNKRERHSERGTRICRAGAKHPSMQGGSKNTPRCRAGAKTALDAGREQKQPSMQGGSKRTLRCSRMLFHLKKNAIFLDLPWFLTADFITQNTAWFGGIQCIFAVFWLVARQMCDGCTRSLWIIARIK